MQKSGVWRRPQGCSPLENNDGDATASKRPIKLQKQLHREKKMLRKPKMASPQSKPQTFQEDHGPYVSFRTTLPRGYYPSPMQMGDGSIGFRDLTPQQVQDWEEEKARERENRFKERVNLMAKLADSKKKYEVKLADAKKKEEAKLADAKKKEEAKLADAKKEEEAKLADAKKEEEAKLADAEKEMAKLAITKKTDVEIVSELDRLEDYRNKHLLQPGLTWEQKVVNILQMVRCREVTEYNHKLGCPAHTRFCCLFNTAFFDLDKESKDMPWEPMDKIPSPRHLWLADSVNIIAIKVAKSDRGYPISVFGIVLARDEYDHRCVYLFKRGRDDPQVITFKDDTLTLMGPYLALAVSDHMHFEFHLKVKGDGDVDEDFSKGVLVHSAVCHSEEPVRTLHLYSCLSTVKFVFTPVLCAVEASFVVILKGSSDFISKVTAWTTGNEVNKIPVYNKEVAAGVGMVDLSFMV